MTNVKSMQQYVGADSVNESTILKEAGLDARQRIIIMLRSKGVRRAPINAENLRIAAEAVAVNSMIFEEACKIYKTSMACLRVQSFRKGSAPPDSAGVANPSDCTNGAIFIEYLDHFIHYVKPTAANAVLKLDFIREAEQESNSSMEVDDGSDIEINPEEEKSESYDSRDFVVMKLIRQKSLKHSFGVIKSPKDENEDYEMKFLKKSKRSNNLFVNDYHEPYTVPRDNVLFKLPKPITPGIHVPVDFPPALNPDRINVPPVKWKYSRTESKMEIENETDKGRKCEVKKTDGKVGRKNRKTEKRNWKK
ncbi:hypothetical protein ILUMI_25063 [Ignelater luminosus]|uniref:Uncharacterized protein n=1 Tax=Ignelater luminosus TaxID=2038154 RepID=A0A8K0FWD1_IGNLU|nr:hypothetical protein ILUMI_25063 [Ignelater luminosus]